MPLSEHGQHKTLHSYSTRKQTGVQEVCFQQISLSKGIKSAHIHLDRRKDQKIRKQSHVSGLRLENSINTSKDVSF